MNHPFTVPNKDALRGFLPPNADVHVIPLRFASQLMLQTVARKTDKASGIHIMLVHGGVIPLRNNLEPMVPRCKFTSCQNFKRPACICEGNLSCAILCG